MPTDADEETPPREEEMAPDSKDTPLPASSAERTTHSDVVSVDSARKMRNNNSATSNSAPAAIGRTIPDLRSTLVRQNAQRITVPTAQTELQYVISRHGEDSWQVKAVKTINSPPFQHFLMALLILDVLILFVEIFLDAAYPHCHVVERDGVSCCPAEEGHRLLLKDVSMAENWFRWLAEEAVAGSDSHAGGGGDHHSICEPPLTELGPAGCDDHKYPAVHTAHIVLFSLTIVILATFEIELIVLLVTLGCYLFFTHFLYVLDLVVVTVSLVLELVFKFVVNNDLLADLTGILVFARVWRFVRIGHGLVVTTMEIETEKREAMEERMEEMERMLREVGQEVPPEKDHSLEHAAQKAAKKAEHLAKSTAAKAARRVSEALTHSHK